MQKWLLLQLLCAANTAAGGTASCTPAALLEAAQSWICQGSPAKLQLIQANLIVENLVDVNTEQPVCWTPLELDGALTYIICALLNTIANGGEPV